MNETCKYKCQIFTPTKNVEELLDWVGYKNNIYGKKVIENSCGDGNILIQIVTRYIKDAIRHSKTEEEIINGIENDIYGIEIDPKHYNKCINNLNKIASNYKLSNIRWNLFCEDSLKKSFDFGFDYVIGNPPYINYRDLDEKTREFTRENFVVCKKGKFDYCYAFIEKGINCLKTHGKMAYIIPGSIFKNVFSKELREYILPHLVEIHDYDKIKLFSRDNGNQKKNILTSSAVIVIEKNSNKKNIIYTNECDNETKKINKKNLGKNNKWLFKNETIKAQNEKKEKFGDFFKASNSVATLLNSTFVITNYKEDKKYIIIKDNTKIEKGILKKAASPRNLNRNVKELIIFPYKFDSCNELIKYNEKELKKIYPNAFKYLKSKKSELDNRKADISSKWFEYGRSQSIKDMNQRKLMISIVVTNKTKVYDLDKNTVPYSGIYIVPKKDKTLDEAKKILESDEFMEYVRNVGIRASGDSIRITSSDVNNYRF